MEGTVADQSPRDVIQNHFLTRSALETVIGKVVAPRIVPRLPDKPVAMRTD